MKKRTLLLAAACAAAVFPAQAKYELVWSDEFDYTSGVNTTVWTFETGTGNWGWGNGESQYYTSREDNVKIEDGKLVITAKKESYGGSSYTSARIKSAGKVQCKYGRIEAYIKVPQGNAGVWPAFWMLGTAHNGSWPYCGEFDIMEVMCTSDVATWSKTLNTYHWNKNGVWGEYQNVNYGLSYTYSEQLSRDYHVYGMEWTPSYVRGYFRPTPDGAEVTVCKMDNSDATSDSEGRYAFVGYEAYMLLNFALGGSYVNYNVASDFTSDRMLVDWVRIYQDRATYPGSTLTDNSTPRGSSVGGGSSSGESGEDDGEVSCDNLFGGYRSVRNTVNDNGNWTGVNGLATVSGTTLTASPSVSYTNMYAVYTGENKALKQSVEYTLTGKIKSTKAATVRVYVEENGNNASQMFVGNEISLAAGQERTFKVSERSGSGMTSADLVLAVDAGPAGAVYTISDVELKPSSCFTAVEETDAESGLRVYPNPAEDRVYVRSEKPMSRVDFVLVTGAEAGGQTLDGTFCEVSVAHLPKGLTMLRVRYADGTVGVSKIVRK